MSKHNKKADMLHRLGLGGEARKYWACAAVVCICHGGVETGDEGDYCMVEGDPGQVVPEDFTYQ
jgi:hypothetical protein